MDLIELPDSQNARFDREIHSPGDLRAKLIWLARKLGRGEARLLDLGGGNGTFLDAVLETYPKTQGTLLDISPSLIAANTPRPNKSIIVGNVSDMARLLPRGDYDVITLNWLLHHLVGPTYSSCGANCVAVLEACKAALGAEGMIVVAELGYEGLLVNSLPSRLVYTLTSIRAGWIVRLLKPLANTAGAGVCFRSRRGWEAIFARAGLKVIVVTPGRPWLIPWWGRLLAIRRVAHQHFYLQPA